MELMLHMCPNCHIQYDRYQPALQYNHCCNNQKIEYGG
ncbi:CoB--CoM heterodisulfide reductase subunit B [Methanosarcina siciliae C2J]|uniref:CoB--CoM heterodisulfide reductase subunit B n=2 Tax=Methanosarcina siciliae TaxID=38027 RepID=A0A0E3PGV8_9EURY|nr:CoB--CoM heterodisulfide reductase subunit B [Methanosarcina siciliae HI350]AKB37975.1 CoB--CoM heterodisulfide reductase subunit B [Methanosarcina siciliae C2J]